MTLGPVSLWAESALIAATLISGLQALSGPFLERLFSQRAFRLIRATTLFQAGLLTLSLMGLMGAYVTNDFSLKNVFENAHTQTPLVYKITGVWGNHEGSMLLWVWLFSVYGAAFALMKAPLTQHLFRARVLWVQGLVTLLNLGYVLFLSSPFKRLGGRLSQGMELNPLLQDLSLAFHPPLLYAGYVGFSIVFACAVAGGLTSQSAQVWQSSARRWCLWSWSFLTLGITLGSWWAYYELGWGGWWFWDPVENASLMPWLCATALLHLWPPKDQDSQIPARLDVRLLSVLTFCFCMLGLCLVRSGVLSTVHAFASDPARGLYLSIITVLVTLVGVACVIKKTSAPPFPLWGWHLDTFLRLQTLIFMGLIFILVVATLYPLLLETLSGTRITVGPPYFTKTFVPLAFVALALMGATPLLPLAKGVPLKQIRAALSTPFWLTALMATLLLYLWDAFVWRSFVGVSLALWLMITTTLRWWQSTKSPLARHGAALAHLGVAFLVLGMSVQTYGQREHLVALRVGDKTTFAGQTFHLKDVTSYQGPTYQGERADLMLSPSQTLLSPEKRFYPSHEVLTSETALQPHGMSLFYAALGGLLPGERWTLHLYYHPLVIWIWLGAMIAALGGFLCLVASRKRGKGA